ncbi:replication protein [Muricauda sp. SCSIO 64092]|uniref:replication protein n=1 Tax=Allomuricauda sp. SCSIO 64092 TaxID=2908842 RepID=UPI001FF4E7E5|nr:replication protein [Muricauda sp. SCSIO 64092]UOY04994.1 replication protein [Muricauda sp. SCSIO 64092]
MLYYKNTTQTPNVIFNDLLKVLTESELKVLLTIIYKTIGQVDPKNPSQRIQRAWIAQKFFCMVTGLSNKSVSKAIDSLVKKNRIRVSDGYNKTMSTPGTRRGASALYYESCLQLSPNVKKASEHSSHNAVKKLHTIKLNSIKQSCDLSSQGTQRLSDLKRFKLLQQMTHVHSENYVPRFRGKR